MLGALSKCLASINSYRPQEMSKHKPGFPRVGKKGKETRFSSRIAGCGCDCDPAWSVEPPVALRAGCCVHTGLAACDPVLSQGKRKVPGLSSTRVMEIWLLWAFQLPWMGSSAHPQAIASVHRLHEEGSLPSLAGRTGASAAGCAVTFSAAWY